jgi:hypothetical protein
VSNMKVPFGGCGNVGCGLGVVQGGYEGRTLISTINKIG